MAQAYASQRVKIVCCTPHFNPAQITDQDHFAFFRTIAQTYNQLTALINDRNIDLQIRLGAEIRLSPDLPRFLETYASLFPLGLAGTHHLLLEFPSGKQCDLTIYEPIIFQLQLTGYTPVLAHPERNLLIGRHNLQILERWIEQERILIQINCSSLCDVPFWKWHKRSRISYQQARLLLDRNLVHCIASDAHDLVRRPPLNRWAFRSISRRYGIERAQRLMQINPGQLLLGQSAAVNPSSH
ncbi:MAG TPA: hypothetical protein DD640_10070 [Clostridiales bacterium]|nr:hypothetical protein [Clostridiales bacterium]